MSQSTVGSRSVVAYAVAIFVRSTRPASKSNLSVVEACPWVVHHHADYSTTQRECFVQKNPGKSSVRLRVAAVPRGYESWLSTPCRFQGAFSLPLDLLLQKCYEHKQYKNGLKFAKQILSNPKFSEHGGEGNCLRLVGSVNLYISETWPQMRITLATLSIFVSSDVSFLWKHLRCQCLTLNLSWWFRNFGYERTDS